MENLTCLELIETFEANSLDKKQKRETRRNDISACDEGAATSFIEEEDFFTLNPNNEPEEIVEVGKSGNEVSFRVRWRGSGGSDWIPARVANRRMPHIVLRYYENMAARLDHFF